MHLLAKSSEWTSLAKRSRDIESPAQNCSEMKSGLERPQAPITEGIEGLTSQQALIVETGLARGAKLELSLACSEIPRMDVMSKSDPFCIFYTRAGKDCWDKLGKTETIFDTASCEWVKKFYITKKLISRQMRFEVYDRDSERDDLKDHDFIGYFEGTPALTMLQESSQHIKVALSREGTKKDLGFLSMTMDWVENPIVNYNVTFEMRVKSTTRVKMYFQILKKIQADGRYVPVFRSRVLDRHDVQFEPSTLKLKQLSGGSDSRPLRIELFQFHPLGKSKVLGYVRTCVEDLTTAPPESNLSWKSLDNEFENAHVTVTGKPDDVRAAKVFQITFSG